MSEVTDHAEAAAFRYVPAFLGAQLEHYDHSGRQGVVDALLHYPDGHTAALEVTSVVPQERRQLHRLLATRFQTLPNPGRWWWSITVDDPRDLPQLRERYERIIHACEAAGAARAEDIAWERRFDSDFTWLLTSSVDMHGLPNSPAQDSPIIVLPAATGGVVDETLGELNASVAALLDIDHVQRRIAKLARSGHPERHLFLQADDASLPFSVAYALISHETVVPSEPLILPGDLTHLWLMVLFSPRLLLADSSGWTSIPRDDMTA